MLAPHNRQRDGKGIPTHVREPLRAGIVDDWDTTAIGTILRGLEGSPYEMKPILSDADYAGAVAGGTATIADALARAVGTRNTMAHLKDTRNVTVGVLRRITEQVRQFIVAAFTGARTVHWQAAVDALELETPDMDRVMVERYVARLEHERRIDRRDQLLQRLSPGGVAAARSTRRQQKFAADCEGRGWALDYFRRWLSTTPPTPVPRSTAIDLHAGVYVVAGGHGTGKSTLLSKMIEQAEAHPAVGLVVAHLFEHRSTLGENRVPVAARSLGHQLVLGLQPDPRAGTSPYERELGLRYDPDLQMSEASWQTVLYGPLIAHAAATPAVGSKLLVLFLDAIDELEPLRDEPAVVKWITETFKLPAHQIRVVLSSATSPSSLRAYGLMEPQVQLGRDHRDHRQDLIAFLDRAVTRYYAAFQTSVADAALREVVGKLVDRSEGSFLWCGLLAAVLQDDGCDAERVAGSAAASSAMEPARLLRTFPQGMAAMLEKYLDRAVRRSAPHGAACLRAIKLLLLLPVAIDRTSLQALLTSEGGTTEAVVSGVLDGPLRSVLDRQVDEGRAAAHRMAERRGVLTSGFGVERLSFTRLLAQTMLELPPATHSVGGGDPDGGDGTVDAAPTEVGLAEMLGQAREAHGRQLPSHPEWHRCLWSAVAAVVAGKGVQGAALGWLERVRDTLRSYSAAATRTQLARMLAPVRDTGAAHYTSLLRTLVDSCCQRTRFGDALHWAGKVGDVPSEPGDAVHLVRGQVLPTAARHGDATAAEECLDWLRDSPDTVLTIADVNILINAIARSDAAEMVENAMTVLNRMVAEGLTPNQITYNTVIKACSRQNPASFRAAVDVADRMSRDGVAVNHYTLLSLLKCCTFGRPRQPRQAEALFRKYIPTGHVHLNAHVESALRKAVDPKTADGLLQWAKAAHPTCTQSPARAKQKHGHGRSVHAHQAGHGHRPERRIDASDGNGYTLDEFIAYYGGTRSNPPMQWQSAQMPRSGSGRADGGGVGGVGPKPPSAPRHAAASSAVDDDGWTTI